MDAAATVRDYYEALRRGEPLYSYFAEDPDVVKVGVSERLVGYEAVAEGLREQSRRTEAWTVESRDLRVRERSSHAVFADDVHLEWRDAAAERTHAFDTRWSGALEPRDDDGERSWLFVEMHVSAPREV